jgi:hypothetical protein
MSANVASIADCSAGSATFTTVLSLKARLDPRMVATSTQRPWPAAARAAPPVRIAASQGENLAMQCGARA